MAAVLNTLASFETKKEVEQKLLEEKLSDVSNTKIDVILNGFAEQGLVRRSKEDTFRLLRKPKAQDMLRVADQYEQKQIRSEEKLKKMISYAQTALCRWKILVNYFGENQIENCGQCDNCVNGRSELHLKPIEIPAQPAPERAVSL